MSGISYHLDLALSLLNAGMVFNVTFMEGHKVMMETTRKGQAATITVEDFVKAHEDRFSETERAFISGVDAIVTRQMMVDLADKVLTDEWTKKIGGESLHGTLEIPERNPMRCSFFLFTNTDWANRAEAKATDIKQLESGSFESGYSGRLGCAVRILPTQPLKLDQLRIGQAAVSMADVKSGLVLVVGAPGVGKSTTAAAYVDHVNSTRSGTIVTAEQPIEVPFTSKASIVTQREVGINVGSVEMALRDAERNFAHTAFVGEIQTLKDEMDTFAAARHGLFVVATSFANNAVDGVKTLVTNIDRMGSDGADLASGTLLAVIYQVRLPGIEDGQWEFAYESVVVHNNEEVIDRIRKRDWPGLQGLVNGDENCSLSGSLAALVREKKVRREQALMNAYDKAGASALLQGMT